MNSHKLKRKRFTKVVLHNERKRCNACGDRNSPKQEKKVKLIIDFGQKMNVKKTGKT